jgi:hypothetical protein
MYVYVPCHQMCPTSNHFMISRVLNAIEDSFSDEEQIYDIYVMGSRYIYMMELFYFLTHPLYGHTLLHLINVHKKAVTCLKKTTALVLFNKS